LFLLFFAQDIAHIDGGYPPSNFNVLNYFLLAGFEVTTSGRFWVTAEAVCLLRIVPAKELSPPSSKQKKSQEKAQARKNRIFKPRASLMDGTT
jgi:hypothetical protein